MTDTPEDFSDFMNANLGGWNTAMGLRFTKVTIDECNCELVIGDQHRQPYGIVHGGVHCAAVETVCSTGAALNAMPRGQAVVGIENSTSFIHAVREGVVRVTGTPLTRGRRSQLWEGVARDANGRIVASGKVRLLCLEPGTDLAGKTVGDGSTGSRTA